MITQRRLLHFATLAKHLHFGRAAEALGISQPALTQSLKGLEAELGVTLVERNYGALALTPFGELVLKRSHSLLTAEEDLRRDIAMLTGNEMGALTVVLGPIPGMTSGYAAAARLLAKHPRLGISLRAGAWRVVAEQVLNRSADLGIGELTPMRGIKELALDLFGQHQGHFFCRPGHPLLLKARPTLADLVEFPWVAPRLPPRLVSILPSRFSAAGSLDPATGDFVPAIEVEVPMQLSLFLKHNDALALATLSMLESALESGEVVVVPTESLPIATSYGFVYLKDRDLPSAAQTYMQEVLSAEEEIKQREAILAKRWRNP